MHASYYRMEQFDSWKVNHVIYPEPGVTRQQPPQQQRGNFKPGADLCRSPRSAGHHLLPHIRPVHQRGQDAPQQGGPGRLLPGEPSVFLYYLLLLIVYISLHHTNRNKARQTVNKK